MLNQKMDRIIEEAIIDLRELLQAALKGSSLSVKLNWPISDKTIAEIGGRLLEDFILAKVPSFVRTGKNRTENFTNCLVPESQRAMEDITFYWKSDDGDIELVLLVDIKGHNEKKRGSRPNLASIRKCSELYATPNSNKELLVFFCRYNPVVNQHDGATVINYEILDTSFNERSIFLLRHLSDRNLDPADIGSGGQILLARENEIQLVKRSREEFVQFLDSLSLRINNFRNKKLKIGLKNNP